MIKELKLGSDDGMKHAIMQLDGWMHTQDEKVDCAHQRKDEQSRDQSSVNIYPRVRIQVFQWLPVAGFRFVIPSIDNGDVDAAATLFRVRPQRQPILGPAEK